MTDFAVPPHRDFVGYGSSASSAEGSPTPNLSNTTAALRNGGGAVDTDNHAADFTVTAPNPRNSSSGGGTRIHDIQGTAHLSPFNGRSVTGVQGVVTAKDGKGLVRRRGVADGRLVGEERFAKK